MASPKLKPNHKTALAASSYQSPFHSESYEPLKSGIRDTILAMGYDKETAVEVGVNWADDHDPFRHVKNHQFGHWANMCNLRVFQSFELPLGPAAFTDLMSARKIGVMVRSFETSIKRPVSFPDSIIVAHTLTQALPDRYFGITTIWSVNQQAIVAEVKGWVVFFDYEKGRVADLEKLGGVYAELLAFLRARVVEEGGRRERWEKENPRKVRAKI